MIFMNVTDTGITLASDILKGVWNNMIEFGEQLRKAREEKGMTQQTLAEQLFVTRQAVSKWECGERYPDLPTTKKISEALDVSLDDLLSGKDMNKVVERNQVVENKFANNMMILSDYNESEEKDMYGAVLGDMVGAPYEFDRGNKSKNFEMFNISDVYKIKFLRRVHNNYY